MTKIEYPWPSSMLVPHAKGHWRRKADATQAARHAARYVTKMHAHGLPDNPSGVWRLLVEFDPPDKRRRDVMNTIAACKAMIDGIADALNVDDRTFVIQWPTHYGPIERGGRVIVRFGVGGDW